MKRLAFGKSSMRMASVAFAVAILGVAPLDTAAAQSSLGKRVYAQKAFCAQCHGWAGDGNPEDDRAPRGANLRETALTPDQIAEVIRCGRPAAKMPYFDRRAWTTDTPCYGMTADDIGEDKPPPAASNLIQREIDALLAYLDEAIVGMGPPTKEQCFAYWGEGSHACDHYPTAAEVEAAPAPGG